MTPEEVSMKLKNLHRREYRKVGAAIDTPAEKIHRLLTDAVDRDEGAGEPIAPRVRGSIGRMTMKARLALGKGSLATPFIDRVGGGDLQRELVLRCLRRLDDDDGNPKLHSVIVDEIRKLWGNPPPTAETELLKIFDDKRAE
jgi:hypothetical protein